MEELMADLDILIPPRTCSACISWRLLREHSLVGRCVNPNSEREFANRESSCALFDPAKAHAAREHDDGRR
jgi:hypothetical protein